MSNATSIWRKRVIVLLLIVVGLYFVGSKLKVTVRDQVQQMHSGPLILNGRAVGQTFVAKRDNLCRIDVYMATSSSRHSGEIELILLDPRSSKVLRSVAVKGSAVKDNQYLSFVFEPIRNSKGETFYFKIKGKLLKPRDVAVWFFSVEDTYPSGAGYVEGRRLGGDLKFSSLSRVSLSHAVSEIFHRVAQGKPSFTGLSFFYAILLASYLLVLALFLAYALPLSRG